MTATLMQLLAAPPVIPIDPESLDATRPVDLDTCSSCMGDGVIDVLVDGEPRDHQCTACAGTGQRSAA